MLIAATLLLEFLRWILTFNAQFYRKASRRSRAKFTRLPLPDLGNRFDGSTAGKVIFRKEDNQRNPDNPKTDQLVVTEWLLVNKDTDQELKCRRDILEQVPPPTAEQNAPRMQT